MFTFYKKFLYIMVKYSKYIKNEGNLLLLVNSDGRNE